MRNIEELIEGNEELDILIIKLYGQFYKQQQVIYKKSEDVQARFHCANTLDEELFLNFINDKKRIAELAEEIVYNFNPNFSKNPIPESFEKKDFPAYYYACKLYKFKNNNNSCYTHLHFSINSDELLNVFNEIALNENTLFFSKIIAFNLIESYIDFKIFHFLANKVLPAEHRSIKTNKISYYAQSLEDYRKGFLSGSKQKSKTTNKELAEDYKNAFYHQINYYLIEHFNNYIKNFNSSSNADEIVDESVKKLKYKGIREYERANFPSLLETLILKNEEPFDFYKTAPISPKISSDKIRLLLEILKIINPSKPIESYSEYQKRVGQNYSSYEIGYFNSLVFGK